MKPQTDEKACPPHFPWASRSLSFCLLLASAFLIHAQWFGGPQPAITTATSALTEAQKLHAEDKLLQQAAVEKGRVYQPPPSEDRLEQALRVIENAERTVPLDPGIRRFGGILALYFDDKFERVEQDFAIDRALDPSWIGGPLGQAEAWAASDPRRSANLWNEALKRAENLDVSHPGTAWSKKMTHQKIRNYAASRPRLLDYVPR